MGSNPGYLLKSFLLYHCAIGHYSFICFSVLCIGKKNLLNVAQGGQPLQKDLYTLINTVEENHLNHGLQTPNEGINQRNLKFSTNVVDEICFGRI